MEYLGYVILAVAVLAWFMAMVVGLVAAFPYGLVGLVAIVGIGVLFAKVLQDRLANEEDDFYDKTVDK